MNIMKKLIYLPIVLALLFVSCKTENKQKDAKQEANNEIAEATEKTAINQEGATHFVDLEKSQILWKGFKPTGSHDGTINLKNGEVEFAEDVVKQANFELDMNSIVNKDMPADDPYNQKLVGHLKSPDFFDVEQFPIASFELKSQTTDEKGQLQFTGDLMIKGKVKSITFPVNITEEGQTILLQSNPFTVDRTVFGIQYKSKNFFKNLKDEFINDEFEVTFNVVLQAK